MPQNDLSKYTDQEIKILSLREKAQEQGVQSLTDDEVKLMAQEEAQVEDKQVVSNYERIAIKNLLDNDPNEAIKFLNNRGYDARVRDGQIQARKQGQQNFGVVDPNKSDLFSTETLKDIFFDLPADAVETLVDIGITGSKIAAPFIGAAGGGAAGGPLGAAGGAVAGIAGSSALGGAIAGGFETGRQLTAKALGVRQELDPGRIAEKAKFGAIVPAGISAVGAGLKTFAKGASKGISGLVEKVPGFQKVAPDIAEFDKAAEQVGGRLAPGQRTNSPVIRQLEAIQMSNPTDLANFTNKSVKETRKIYQEQKDIADKFINDIRSLAEGKSSTELSKEAEDALFKEVSAKQAQASAIFKAVESETNKIPISEESRKLINEKLDELIKRNRADDASETALKGLKDKFATFKNVDDLKSLNTAVILKRDRREISGGFDLQRIIKDQEMNDIISNSDQIAKNIGKTGQELSDELKSARATYAETIDKLEKSFNLKKNPNVSPGQELSKYLENVSDQKFIKNFDLKDRKQLLRLQNNFPEVADRLKKAKIEDLFENNVNRKNPGEAVLKQLNALKPEVKELVLGENYNLKLKALLKLQNKFPNEWINFSNTMRQKDAKGVFNILNQASNVSRAKLLQFLSDAAPPEPLFKIRPIRSAVTRQVLEETSPVRNKTDNQSKSVRQKFIDQGRYIGPITPSKR